jgi:hypothetical protein
MKHELRGLLSSGHPTRTEEWHDPEPAADDDPQVAGGPLIPGRSNGSVEELRYELARLLGRSAVPAVPGRLKAALRERHAPDALVDMLDLLPGKATYGTPHELAEALMRAYEEA